MKGEGGPTHRPTMYGNTLRTMLEKFMDKTAGETFNKGRLITRERESGNVELVAYGWLKLAEYNELREAVTVFTGHKSLGSHTLARWLNAVVRVANDRGRDVILSGESPTVDTPNAGVQYINNYVSMDGAHSPVEQEAVETVESGLPSA